MYEQDIWLIVDRPLWLHSRRGNQQNFIQYLTFTHIKRTFHHAYDTGCGWLSNSKGYCYNDSWIFQWYHIAWLQIPCEAWTFIIWKVYIYTRHNGKLLEIEPFFCNFDLDRLYWYVIQLSGLAAAVYIFIYAMDTFAAKPTVTSLESVNYPIHEVPFPSVAICPVNKISKTAAMNYANIL